jgi:hypothetical protein
LALPPIDFCQALNLDADDHKTSALLRERVARLTPAHAKAQAVAVAAAGKVVKARADLAAFDPSLPPSKVAAVGTSAATVAATAASLRTKLQGHGFLFPQRSGRGGGDSDRVERRARAGRSVVDPTGSPEGR